MPIDFKNFALMLLSKNPNVANNPQALELVNVIKNGDEEKGRQIAENMCKTYGVTMEEAAQKAKTFFNI